MLKAESALSKVRASLWPGSANHGGSVSMTVDKALIEALESNAAGPTSSPAQTVLLTDRQAGSGAPADAGHLLIAK